jgi:hypothetical protein
MFKPVILAAALAARVLTYAQGQSQPPEISGVWKADLQKSKIPGPPIAEYLVILQQKTVEVDKKTGEKAPEIDELAGIKTQRGESRSTLSFLSSGRPRVRPYEGVPMRMVASWQGQTLTLNGETAGTPGRIKRVYEVSPDGQSMTLEITLIGMRPDRSNTVRSSLPSSPTPPVSRCASRKRRRKLVSKT